MKKPSEKLIKETKTLIRLKLFLRQEVGLRENLSSQDLKVLLKGLKISKK